ncbi:unnamed protein product [Malus baccata var. baccata]
MTSRNNVPHAVCIPFPVQSHIKGMRQLAQLLHHRGVHVTFVNTEFNHKRFLKSLGPNSLDGVPGFRFETIPDGLQTSDEDTQQDITLLAEAIRKNFLAPFRDLLDKLNHTAGDAPVTHIVADGWMSAFPMEAAEEIGIPVVLFFTISACSLMGYIQFPALVEKGLVPLKGMKGIRLRDLPKDMRVTNPNDKYWKYCLEAIQRFVKGSAVVVHSFGALEKYVLDALLSLLPVVYAIGNKKPHLLCIPFPAQSHIKAMLKFAKLLHHGGFHITFVNTEFNHKLYLKSLGPDSLDGLPDFRFETMPDGLQSSDEDTTQDLISLVESVGKNFTVAFRDILVKLDRSATCNDIPPVSHIVSDGWMAFTVTAAEEVGIPVVLFFTISASSFMGFNQYPTLEEKGLAPLKEESWLTNGFLDKVLDWVPGMKDMRLRDLPNNFITTDPNDVGWVFCMESIQKFKRGSAIVIHTFDALEHEVLDSLSSMFPRRLK